MSLKTSKPKKNLKKQCSQRKQGVCWKTCRKIYKHIRKIHFTWKMLAKAQRL